jgi:phosphopantothenoylcysteine synthetase/decarboxylase
MNKLKDKNIDLVVINKAKYIGKDFNEFSICSTDLYKELGSISKKDLAKNLVDKLEKLLS